MSLKEKLFSTLNFVNAQNNAITSRDRDSSIMSLIAAIVDEIEKPAKPTPDLPQGLMEASDTTFTIDEMRTIVDSFLRYNNDEYNHSLKLSDFDEFLISELP